MNQTNIESLKNLFSTIAQTCADSDRGYTSAEIGCALKWLGDEYVGKAAKVKSAAATTPPKQDFDTAFANFMKLAQGIIDEHYKQMQWAPAHTTLKVEKGTKYAKILRPGSGVWGFVDMTNGDILKAASWKAPAKHARGSIYDANPVKNCSWTGPNYLK